VLTESRFFKGIILSATLLLLAACSSSPTSTTSSSGTPPMSASDAYQASRYDIQQDRASSQLLDPAQIREVIPMRETRTSAGNKSPYTVNGKTYRVMESEQGYRERGFASWYGEKFHGHKTSNGEIYDMFQLSAAHKSMPLPGFVRVTNLENNRSIVVRVNDRGPFHSERIIDLSYAAAYMLGFDNKGTAMVEVEAIIPTLAATIESPRPPSPAALAPQQPGGGAILQVGAFSDLQAAQQLTMKLQKMTSRPVFIRSVEIGEERELIHRVRVGPIPSADEIGRITDSVVAADLGRPYTVRE
jgi:rare lipoprotein A